MYDRKCLENISGLPPSGSWQDLKDHMREAGDVSFTDVYANGSGVVEFQRKDDARYAIRYLDDTKFKSHEVRIEPSVFSLFFPSTNKIQCFVITCSLTLINSSSFCADSFSL